MTESEDSSPTACLASHSFVYYLAVLRVKLASAMNMEEEIVPKLSVIVVHGYLQDGETDCNGSHGLRYDVYFVRSDGQLKVAIALAYEGPVTAGVATEAPWETRKVLQLHKQDGNDVESKEGANVSEMDNYYISSDISKE